MAGILEMLSIRLCFDKHNKSSNLEWCTLHLTVLHGALQAPQRILKNDWPSEMLQDPVWSSHRKSARTSPIMDVAITSSNPTAVRCFKKIYLKILFIFLIFQITENDNASINACMVQRTSASTRSRRPLVSTPTSNGPRLLCDALDTKVVNMPTCVALDPTDFPEHPLQQPILEACAKRCGRTSSTSYINEIYYILDDGLSIYDILHHNTIMSAFAVNLAVHVLQTSRTRWCPRNVDMDDGLKDLDQRQQPKVAYLHKTQSLLGKSEPTRRTLTRSTSPSILIRS